MSCSLFCAVQVNISRCGFISGAWRALTLSFPAALDDTSHLDLMLLIESPKKLFWGFSLQSYLVTGCCHFVWPNPIPILLERCGSQREPTPDLCEDNEGQVLGELGCTTLGGVLRDPVPCCTVPLDSHSDHSRIHIMSPVCPDVFPQV